MHRDFFEKRGGGDDGPSLGPPENCIHQQDGHPTPLGLYSVKGSPPTIDVKLLGCPQLH